MILVLGILGLRPRPLVSSAAISLENVALQASTGGAAAIHRSPPGSTGGPWAGQRSSLVVVQPATVLTWHRQGFQPYWRWKSRRRSVGRPPLDLELRFPIRRMARENPTWRRRRIQAELRFLGYEVAALTVIPFGRSS
jgi:hypothetical protein